MSMTRLATVFWMELKRAVNRPSWRFLAVLVCVLAWGLSQGNVQIASGDGSVGGRKALFTSEFQITFLLAVFLPLVHLFFIAIAAGMAVPEDDELNVGPLLNATPLRPAELIGGKFFAIFAAYALILLLQLLAMMVCMHLLPHDEKAEQFGPLVWSHYLKPYFVFCLPTIFAYVGVSMFVGVKTRRPILIYLFPLALATLSAMFLFNWSPSWLDPRVNEALMIVDLSGFRWLVERWLKEDRGVAYYNTAAVPFDRVFWMNRAFVLVLGALGLAASVRSYARGLRRTAKAKAGAASAPASEAQPALQRLAAPARPAGFLSALAQSLRFELRQLIVHPAIYLFVPLILLEAWGNVMIRQGFLETPILHTPGALAVALWNVLTLTVTLLLLFFTVEAFERERSTGLAPLYFSTPAPTAALLFGKTLAVSVVGALALVCAFLGSWALLLWQQTVPMNIVPFVLVWGGLLTVTYFLWVSFVLLLHSLTRNRYATYGLALGMLILFGYLQFTDKLNWVGNWMLWGALRWSDTGPMELDWNAIVLSRLFGLSLGVFFVFAALRWFPRRELDASRVLHRLRWKPLIITGLKLLPAAAPPLILGIWLWRAVETGREGALAERRDKDYWKQNLNTWKDVRPPALKDVKMKVALDPAKSHYRVEGEYELLNDQAEPLRQFALTAGRHWRNLKWTLNGQPFEPENRSSLFVFTLKEPLAKDGAVRIGFAHEAEYPFGIGKLRQSAGEFVLPGGVVLNSFSTSFAPAVGYVEEIGVDDKNRYEPRQYAEDLHLKELAPLFGSATPFTARIEIVAPAEYTCNSVGVRESDAVKDGMRTTVWKTDQPVRFFNIVAGKWRHVPGKGVALYVDPQHPYNVEAMKESLEASREWFGKWFGPFPWQELKVSQFPNWADYAQGFPTNIVFTEGMVLAKDDEETNANSAFIITAHEAAHQWWGNMLTPGKGPGANILSEGLAHYSTMLLLEQVKGLRQRMEFCKKLEASYTRSRRFDAELPLVKIQGNRPGDTTITYDKGSWVFWMLDQHLGREKMLAGLKKLIERYRTGRDHPMLEDLVVVLREEATDKEAFDRFVKEHFFQVVLPEYQFADVKKEQGGANWTVTAKVTNAGTGTYAVEIAAVKGERFPKESGKPEAAYQEAKQVLQLGPGESKELKLTVPFDPERLVADPDIRILQLFRQRALHKF